MIDLYKEKVWPLLIGLFLLVPFVGSAQMRYSSSTVTQNTAKVITGSLNQQVIGIRVVTSGTTTPLSVTRFNLTTTGTTRTADIKNARIYYTGTSATFATTNQFGTTVAAPNGSYAVSSTRALAAGTNYFWLTYDIADNAVVNNLVDATCASFVLSGTTRTPTATAPAGARKIEAPLSNIYTINKNGTGSRNFTTFSAAIALLNANGVTGGGVTFIVSDGQTFNESPLTISASGNSTNPIVFEKSGTGANPIIQGTGGTGTADNMLTINSGDYITFDGIDLKDNASNTTANTKMERGLQITSTASNGSMYNAFLNGSITLDKNNTNMVYGIYANNTAASSTAGTNSYNTFFNNTITNTDYGIYLNGNATYYDNSNEIGNDSYSNTIKDFSTRAIYLGQQLNAKVYNNNISNGVGTAVTGIHVVGANSTASIHDNNISTLSTTSTTGKLVGIHAETAANVNIYANTLTEMAATATGTSTATVQGVEVNAGASNISNNLISNFSNASAGTGGIVNGIVTKGGTTHSVVNNMVSDLRANASTANPSVRAISLEGGTTINLYFNSLHLSGVATAASHSSATLYVTATPGSVNMRNNILYNNYNVNTGTRAVAFFKSSTSYTNIATATNNNLIFAGTASAKKLLFYDGTNAVQTLSAYKTRLGPTRESAATSIDPNFVSPSDLHLSQCYAPNRGPAITSVTEDIDGDVRAANPVIGADETTEGVLIARWLGDVSTDWNNSANWACNLVPLNSSDVIIPATATRQPIITAVRAVAKSITIEQGASVTIAGGSLTISEDLNLNGTLTNEGSGTLTINKSLILNSEESNAVGALNNTGTITVGSGITLNEGYINNNGNLQIGTDLIIKTGSGNNYVSNSNTLEIAQNLTSEADVNIENTGSMTVEGDLTTSSIFLNNGMDGPGKLVVNGKLINTNNGHFTNLFGVATVNDFYNNALIDGDLGSFVIAGISENTNAGIIKGGIDLCDSSLEPGSTFVDTNNGLIEWGEYDNDPDDGVVTQCGVDKSIVALPVTLITWKATLKKEKVLLTWQTASEKNSAWYYVERSTDGLNFTKIASIVAAGNSNDLKSYAFTDEFVPNGTVYYRIKQTDFDGSFTYTSIISVSPQIATFSTKVFPNPVNSQERLHIWFSGNVSQRYLVEAVDMQGSLLYQHEVLLKANTQELIIPKQVTARIKGLCLIRCTDLTNNSSRIMKVMVQ